MSCTLTDPYSPAAEFSKIPRTYVSDLEAQVEKLTRENHRLRTAASPLVGGENASTVGDVPLKTSPATDPAAPDADGSIYFHNLVKSVRNVVVEPSRQPRFLGQSSGITLARLVMAAIRVDALPATPRFPEQRPCDPSTTALAAKASLPPRHAADHLVDVYFQYRTLHLPIVDRKQVQEALDNAYLYNSGRELPERVIEKDVFTAYMVLAIALCDLSNSSGGRPSQSEGCFRSAIAWIEKVITYSKSELETLRVILLLAQFVALCPSQGSLWHLTGTALRLCIDMGLHWETEEQSLHMDQYVLQDRRRLWYTTYQFDRVLCITLGRPFGIIDESMRVPLPDPWAVPHSPPGHELHEFDINHQQAHNHLFILSQLESEIKHVQHSQDWTPKIAYPRANYAAWVKDIQPRLEKWYESIPQPSKAHPSSIFAHQAYWNSIYNNSILLLYRPNAIILPTSTDALFKSFEASSKFISSVKILQREGKVEILWKAVHQLFMAGLGVIYGLWHSREIRDCNSIGHSISTLQSCTSTLSAMSENFPGAAGCRDAFDTLSSATIEWLVNKDTNETPQNHLDFEEQAKSLLQQLQPPREGMVVGDEGSTDSMLNMLATDTFAFSEMLSSAAQWPEFQDMGFIDMELGSMTGTGINLGLHHF